MAGSRRRQCIGAATYLYNPSSVTRLMHQLQKEDRTGGEVIAFHAIAILLSTRLLGSRLPAPTKLLVPLRSLKEPRGKSVLPPLRSLRIGARPESALGWSSEAGLLSIITTMLRVKRYNLIATSVFVSRPPLAAMLLLNRNIVTWGISADSRPSQGRWLLALGAGCISMDGGKPPRGRSIGSVRGGGFRVLTRVGVQCSAAAFLSSGHRHPRHLSRCPRRPRAWAQSAHTSIILLMHMQRFQNQTTQKHPNYQTNK